MKNRRVLVSGASVAGPALALWLSRYGWNVTVVERARELRGGGHAVDFRGPTHMGLLEKMGVLGAVLDHRTTPRDTVIVDGEGAPKVTLPAVFMAGDVEVERGDLSRILYDASRGSATYCFGDHITSLVEHPGGVDVTFAHAPGATFDLVVGADGLHSGVRALAFGPDERHVRFHGYYVATFRGPNVLALDRTVLYSEPGRCVSVMVGRDPREATTLCIFASPPRTYDRHDRTALEGLITSAFAGMGWETARLLAEMPRSPELYFDAIGSVDLARFARGRVALVGDAAYGGTLGGQGTGLALVGGYVLAGELARAGGDHRVAFAEYERQIGDYARGCQKGASRVGPFYAPRTRAGTWLRDTVYGVLTSRPMLPLFEKLVKQSASAVTLREYAPFIPTDRAQWQAA